MHYIYGLNLYNFYLKNHSIIKMSTVNGVFTSSPQKKKVMIGMKGSSYTNQFLWTTQELFSSIELKIFLE